MSKILVIDDEAWLREIVRLALLQRGFEVIQAENGAAGIEVARKEVPDLVLCDVNMGKVDGYLTLASLRNEPATAAIPFILMTGLADNAGMRHGMELGADDYLPKPFTLEALYAAVDARLKKVRTVRIEAERQLAALRSNITLMLPHELRTPLNGILSMSEMLGTDARSLPPEEIAEMGKMIFDSSKRLQRLIENFLIYAQIELIATDSLKVANLRQSLSADATDIVANAAREQSARAQRETDLRLQLTAVSLQISEDHLGKIVDELVGNAFKFSPARTTVTLSMTSEGPMAVIQLTNQGRGFSADQISRVGAYMQFDRKLHEQQGLGLGLAIAKRLVELYGGSLKVQSGQSDLTSVVVRLPCQSATEARFAE